MAVEKRTAKKFTEGLRQTDHDFQDFMQEEGRGLEGLSQRNPTQQGNNYT
jgi:hypothetical protein